MHLNQYVNGQTDSANCDLSLGFGTDLNFCDFLR